MVPFVSWMFYFILLFNFSEIDRANLKLLGATYFCCKKGFIFHFRGYIPPRFIISDSFFISYSGFFCKKCNPLRVSVRTFIIYKFVIWLLGLTLSSILQYAYKYYILWFDYIERSIINFFVVDYEHIIIIYIIYYIWKYII